MFRAYTYKLFKSPLLYIGIFGVFLLCCTQFIDNGVTEWSVMYYIDLFLDMSQYRKTIAVFGALPFAANFADEWINGVTKECIVRKGIKKYAAANLIFCWFSTIFTVLGGMWLFIGIYSLFVPMSEPYTNPYYFIFGQFLHNNQGDIFILLKTFIFSVSCGMWAVMGMLLSVFFPNKFVAICTPFVASYAIERITEQFNGNFNLYYLSLSYLVYDDFGSDLLGFLYCVGFFTIIAILCGIAFYIFFKRKVQNEIS